MIPIDFKTADFVEYYDSSKDKSVVARTNHHDPWAGRASRIEAGFSFGWSPKFCIDSGAGGLNSDGIEIVH